MNSVGIDISKGRSTVAVMRPFGEVVISLFEVRHTDSEQSELVNYGLDRWHTLPKYIPEEDTGLLLKNCYRQYRQYSMVQTVLKNNLSSLLDTVFPNTNRLFSSPVRADRSEKWGDFVAEFWHWRCVCEKSEKAFTNNYQRWCSRHGYNFSEEKVHAIYTEACRHIGVMPKSETTAGINAPLNDSGDVTGRHKSMSKIGASSLRRTLFLAMSVYLQNSPPDEPVYQFMDKKRAEGKPYRIYMMASVNKFLRPFSFVYYSKFPA